MPADPTFESIRPRTKRVGRCIVHVKRVDSTMRLAREYAAAGQAEGLVVVADEQTGGRGRLDRRWESVGESLHATVLLRPPPAGERLQTIPLVAGRSACEAVARVTGVEAGLKWPNDVMIDDKKVGGVLVDAVHESPSKPPVVLVGVGINGNARKEALPKTLRLPATTLSMAAGRSVCLPAVLKVFLERLESNYDEWAAGGDAWRAPVESVMQTVGRRVRVSTPEAVIEGHALVLGPFGELVVQTEAGRHSVRSGDCEHLDLA